MGSTSQTISLSLLASTSERTSGSPARNDLLGDNTMKTKAFSSVLEDQQCCQVKPPELTAESNQSLKQPVANGQEQAMLVDVNGAVDIVIGVDQGNSLPIEDSVLPQLQPMAVNGNFSSWQNGLGATPASASIITPAQQPVDSLASATQVAVPVPVPVPFAVNNTNRDSLQHIGNTMVGDVAEQPTTALISEAKSSSSIAGDLALGGKPIGFAGKVGEMHSNQPVATKLSVQEQRSIQQQISSWQTTENSDPLRTLSATLATDSAAFYRATQTKVPAPTSTFTNPATNMTTNMTPTLPMMSASQFQFSPQTVMDSQNLDAMIDTPDRVLTETLSKVASELLKPNELQAYRQPTTNTAFQTAVPIEVGRPGWSGAIMEKVMWMSSQNMNSAEIALDPPELGPLQVRISTTNDQTSVVFSSHNTTVREALDLGLNKLREMMDDGGLNLSQLSVLDQSAQQRQGKQADESTSEEFEQEGNSSVTAEEAPTSDVQQMRASRVLNLVDQYI